MKKTLVLGASTNTSRYSNIAIHRLVAHKQPVVAIGLKTGMLAGIEIMTGMPDLNNVHTVTLYLNAKRQEQYYDYLVKLKPQRIIFNPGTENPEFYQILKENGILVDVACTLVLLASNQY